MLLKDAVIALHRWQEKVQQPPLGLPNRRLRAGLGHEILLEKAITAMKLAAHVCEQNKDDFDPRWLRLQLLFEECAETCEAIIKGNVIETLDGLCDLLYVTIGAGVRFNVDISGAFTEVVRSNDSKSFSGDSRVRDKGPNYSPPDLTPFI